MGRVLALLRQTGLLIVAVLLGGPIVFQTNGQAQAPPQSTFRASVELVEVDVSVLDKNRQPVRGLTQTDFTIIEDGKPRPVAAFTAVDLPSRPAPGSDAPWTRGVPSDVATNDVPSEGRLVVILMDRSIPLGAPTLMARRIAQSAVEELSASDLAAVVYTGEGASQDFTNDRARLLATINGLQPAAGLPAGAAERWEIMNDKLEAELWKPGDPVPRILPNFSYSGECLCGLCVPEAIARIADTIRDVPRRNKSLLFIGTDITIEATPPQCVSRARDARAAMFRAVDLGHITVHSFDANGLETLSIQASSGTQGQDLTTAISPRQGALAAIPAKSRANLVRQGNIAVLPDRTGGRTVLNTNDADLRMAEVFKESSTYYLLGFHPAAPPDGRRHEINVKVNRRGVDVRTRRAYVAAAQPSAATASVASTSSLERARKAIEGPTPVRDGMTLTVSAASLLVPATRDPIVMMAVEVHDEGRPDAAPRQSVAETVDVVTAAFGVTGEARGVIRQTLSVTPRASADGVIYEIAQRLPMKPGQYELRIGIHNPARNHTGSVFTSVAVPNVERAPFALSDVVLNLESSHPAPAEAFADVLPVAPTARRQFGREEYVTAFLRLYQRGSSTSKPVTILTRIIDAQDRVRWSNQRSVSAEAFGEARAADHQIGLPLTDLDAGPYLLSIVAVVDGAPAERRVLFAVR